MSLTIEDILSVHYFSTAPARQAGASLLWSALLGTMAALVFTGVFNFLVRETLALVRQHARAGVPVTGAREPGLLRLAWAFSALAGLVGAVLVITVLNATGGDPVTHLEDRLAAPPQTLMIAVNTVTACLTAGMLALCFLLLRNRAGSVLARVYFLAMTAAWVALMIGLYFTNWLRVS